MRRAQFLILASALVLIRAGTAERPVALNPQALNLAETALSLPAQAARIPNAEKPAAIMNFSKIPVYFIPNGGQVDGAVDFYIQGKDKAVYFTPEGVTFALSRGAKRWAVKMDFVGARKDAKPEALDKTGAVISYFKGKPEEWHAGLPAYSAIIYRDLWPGIDLVYKGTIDKLKYEYVVHPGADLEVIRMALRGAETARIDEAGRLEITTPAGSFDDETPLAYQNIGGSRAEVAMAFKLAEAEKNGKASAALKSYFYSFEVGAYDKTNDLVLDPATLMYCGYIGGSGNDEAYSIAVDEAGNAYVTGFTRSTESSFPVTVGPDLAYNDPFDYGDAFVAKVNPSGTALLYCGYIGGSAGDGGYGIAVDGSGNAYVTGYTAGRYPGMPSFPVAVGPDLTFNGDNDVFVTKINPSGSALVYSGYIGGSGADMGYGIAVDGAGNAYITGYTRSTESTFPAIVGPDVTYNGGTSDIFVAKVRADGSGLVYCGYIGGSVKDVVDEEVGYGIAVDSGGNAYVTGWTLSTEASFPVMVGPDLTYNGDKSDAFVAKVKADGSALVYCGYIGGSAADQGRGVAVDGVGNAYVTGYTASTQTTFPVKVGPDLTHHGSWAENWDAFVAKVDSTGSALVYCGFVGDAPTNDEGHSIAVDGTGSAYVAVTGYPNVAKIKADGSGFVYSFVFVQIYGSIDQYNGIAIDGMGNAYVTGYTMKTQNTFPVKVGPDLTHNGGVQDAFVAKIQNGFKLTLAVGTGGTTNPAPGATKCDENSVVTVQAIPSSGYAFDRWTGDVPAGQETNATISMTMSGDKSLTAAFKKGWILTIYSVSGGTTNPGAGASFYGDGTIAQITAAASSGYWFDRWTGDAPVGSETNNPLQLTMNSNKSLTPGFLRPYTLKITAGPGGTTNPTPGTYAHDGRISVSVQAIAEGGYQFDSWSGDASGSSNPLVIVMSANKSIQADFARAVRPPLNLTGEKRANRSVAMIEYVVRLLWQANTANSGTISYRVYQIENGQATKIADVAAGKFEHLVRGLQVSKAYRFGVTAVDSRGWESDMTEVAIQ